MGFGNSLIGLILLIASIFQTVLTFDLTDITKGLDNILNNDKVKEILNNTSVEDILKSPEKYLKSGLTDFILNNKELLTDPKFLEFYPYIIKLSQGSLSSQDLSEIFQKINDNLINIDEKEKEKYKNLLKFVRNILTTNGFICGPYAKSVSNATLTQTEKQEIAKEVQNLKNYISLLQNSSSSEMKKIYNDLFSLTMDKDTKKFSDIVDSIEKKFSELNKTAGHQISQDEKYSLLLVEMFITKMKYACNNKNQSFNTSFHNNLNDSRFDGFNFSRPNGSTNDWRPGQNQGGNGSGFPSPPPGNFTPGRPGERPNKNDSHPNSNSSIDLFPNQNQNTYNNYYCDITNCEGCCINNVCSFQERCPGVDNELGLIAFLMMIGICCCFCMCFWWGIGFLILRLRRRWGYVRHNDESNRTTEMPVTGIPVASPTVVVGNENGTQGYANINTDRSMESS